MKKRKKKKEKAKELIEGRNVIDIDDERKARRERLSQQADASRRKRGEKSIKQEMLEELARGEEQQEKPAERKRRKKKKITSPVVKITVVGIVVFMAVLLICSVGKIVELKIQESHAEAEIERLKEEKALLEEQVQQIGSDTYMEQQARDLLKMARQGEVIYILDGE